VCVTSVSLLPVRSSANWHILEEQKPFAISVISHLFPFSSPQKASAVVVPSTDTMEPSTSSTWVLLVNHEFQNIGSRFLVNTVSGDLIHYLKKKVKEEAPEVLSRVRADPHQLTVWMTKSDLIINKFTFKQRLAEILRSIDVNSKETIELLNEEDLVADLGLSHGQALLVRLPGTSRISTPIGCVLIHPNIIFPFGTSPSSTFCSGNTCSYKILGKEEFPLDHATIGMGP
jgi:hypothetical protein